VREITPEEQKRIRQQANRAAYGGAEPGPWRKWRDLIGGLGISSHEASRLLPRESLRWYARFCFENGLTEDGITAYELLLEGNVDAQWIYDQEARRYLDAVRSIAGPAGVVRAFDRFARIAGDAFPEEQLVAAEAEAELGRPDAALERMRSVTSHYHESGRHHAALARHLFSTGDLDESRKHLTAAAKRGTLDHATIDLQRLGLTASDLQQLASRYRVPSVEESVAAFVSDPGLTLLPSKRPSPHSYGGDEFEMPPCPGCHRPITLIATVDAKSEPSLSRFAETLPRLPIPHCRGCQLMFHSPDYVVSEDDRRIELFNVHPLFTPGEVFAPGKPLVRQFAKLARPRRLKSASPTKAFDHLEEQQYLGPQFGGAPPWINDPRRRFCPRCDEEQVFYAAACETEGFKTPVSLNPDGYIYFFACIPCRIIRTSIDNT
jgi:hypothetical protein